MNSSIPTTSDGKLTKPLTTEQFETIGTEIYFLMQGSYILPHQQNGDWKNGYYSSPLAYKVANETETGKGAELLDKIWSCRMKVKEKMGIIQGDDDDDILQIIESYEEYLRLFVCKALEYGYHIGNGEW